MDFNLSDEDKEKILVYLFGFAVLLMTFSAITMIAIIVLFFMGFNVAVLGMHNIIILILLNVIFNLYNKDVKILRKKHYGT